ncbi:MAG TPA: reverse transcriptase family protein [Saprospiraceae bacterium]|nr:reverse transcriptase family protein [Saprospiraceae bacterium]HMQ85743.1 reverse transcriptase family protein [Saprospiraceae bacterium]
MNKNTKARHQQNKMVFCSINSVKALCQLLQIDQRRMQLLLKKPPYKVFHIPKKDGGERIIEAPGNELKKVLSILNRYLQSVYFFERSNAVYGFVAGVRNDEDRRNVLTNAKKHVGKPYLLNIDLADFFHSISQEKVYQIFSEQPFQFKREIPELLAGLTTYQGHLPMGTPTSPVLSNFACCQLDLELYELSQDMGWIFTRYADDMTFSAGYPILKEKVDVIRFIVEKQGFRINERKVKMFGPSDDKIVTGLLVSDQVSLAPDYLPRLEKDIEQLALIMQAQNEQGELHTRWVEQYKRHIIGRLNFAAFVMKRNSAQYMALKDSYYTAINPPQEEFGAISWRGFPYNL